MIAERYDSTYLSFVIRLLPMLLLVTFTAQSLQAQDRISTRERQAPVIISAEAQARIEATIATRRQEKVAQGAAFTKTPRQLQTLASVRSSLASNAAVETYSSSYFDTQDQDQFSFPEDTHDFCRASFNSFDARQDYYLDMQLDAAQSLSVDLSWSNQADYDLYLFDASGYPVGDPEGVLEGANGLEYQNAGDPLDETAVANNNSGQAQPVLLVVDRFRGNPTNTLTVSVTGSDDNVLEYILADNLTYLNAGTDQTVGPLVDGIVVDNDVASNFAAQYNTDGCAQSIVFTLVNGNGDPVLGGDGNPVAITDSAPPFAAFGDDGAGDFFGISLLPGTYTLTGTPFSQVAGGGVSGAPLSATFSIGGEPPEIDSLSIPDTTINELTDLNLTVLATDPNNLALTYSIDAASLAAGMTIDAASGDYAWTPSEVQGPGLYPVVVTVVNTDGLADIDTFQVTVLEVNLPPVLAAIADTTIGAETPIQLTATATDPDIPVNTLTFSLDAASEALGMTIDPTSGAFSWTPASGQTGSFPVTVTVTDDGGVGNDVPLSDDEPFTITVNDGTPTAAIVSFTLINADDGTPFAEFDPIVAGDTIDIVQLPPNLALRGNPLDPQGVIETVQFDLTIDRNKFTPVTDPAVAFTVSPETINTGNSDADGQPYLLPWQNNGNFLDPNTLPNGDYSLVGTPSGSTAAQYTAGSINFTVIGPRISNYTLINAATNDPIPGFDPLVDGVTIVIGSAPSFNIRANTIDYGQVNFGPEAGQTDSEDFGRARAIDVVKFRLPGQNSVSAQESYRPYAVFGDCNMTPPLDCTSDVDPPFATDALKPNYNGVTLQVGTGFILTGVPFASIPNAIGFDSTAVTFNVTAAGGEQPGEVPSEPTLLPNYPNPFNPVTTIRFNLPEAAPVKLAVFDMLGRQIKVLVDGAIDAGVHEVSFEAGSLSSGMYLYKLETPAGVQVRPMTLLK